MDRVPACPNWALVALLGALCACGAGGGGDSAADDAGGGGSASLADLTCTAVGFQPASAVAGTALSVSDTVENQGGGAAPEFQVGIYLSSDATIGPGDRLLGFRTIGSLASGASSSGGGSLTVPASTVAGTYYVGAWVDDPAAVEELSDSNNVRAATGVLAVSPAVLPNVVPTAVTFTPLAVAAGATIDVSDTVKNVGVAAAGAFSIGVYLSDDPQVSTADRLIGLRALSSLATGESASGGGPLTVPGNLAAGSYYVAVIADPGGALAEIDELDNARVASAQLSVSAPPRPDLTVASVSFTPAIADTGTEITIDAAVENDGIADASAFELVFYLSTDSTITKSDELLGSRAVDALAVGATDAGVAAVVVPIELDAGSYYVGALADPENDVAELDETNNAQRASATIQLTVPPRPDLVVGAVSFQPSVVDVDQRDRVTVTELVKNLGTYASPAFRVGVYLSANNVISTSDVLIGTRTVDALALGNGSGGTSELPLPLGLSPGTYYLGVVADDESAALELRESNNVLLASATLDVISTPAPRPDLLVQTLAFSPAQVLTGGTVQVQSVVRNEGNLSAGAFQVGIYLSEDDVVSVDDRKIAERTIFQLGIQFGSASSAPYLLPLSVEPGDYYVGAIADIHDAVAESEEENNALVAVGRLRVYVPPPPAPDLAIESVSGTLAPDRTSITVACTVKNRGDLAAGAFRAAFVLSTDGTADTADVALGTLAIGGLGASQTFQGTASFDVPKGLADGTYRVCAIADDQEVVSEGTEDDNSRCAEGTLHLP